MIDPTDATLRSYERHADRYAATSAASVNESVAALLDVAVARLSPGSHVLELGSGPGLEADYLEERGLVVDRTDATAAFVKRLRAQGHNARLLDAREADLGGPYDAVLANAVLLHLARGQTPSVLAACARAARPGGLLLLTLKAGDGEAWSKAKLDSPRWFVYWRAEPLRDVLEDVGWQVLDLTEVEGRSDPWLHAVCCRGA